MLQNKVMILTDFKFKKEIALIILYLAVCAKTEIEMTKKW